MNEAVEIAFRQVNYTFEGETQPSLMDINFEIRRGEWVSIVGPGGSGKTTLCRLLAGFHRLDAGSRVEGEIWLGGKELTNDSPCEAGSIGIVFQDPDAQLIQAIVEDELAFGPENLLVEPVEIGSRIDYALTEVGLPEMRKHHTNMLSGGQKQRIAIASVLTMQPTILLFDDASASLDRPAAEQFMATLSKLHMQGHTILIVSTKLDQAQVKLFDRLIVLNEGKIIANDVPQIVIDQKKETLIRLGCWPNDKYILGELATDIKAPKEELPVLEIRNLGFQYPSLESGTGTQILNDVNLNVYKGDFIAILGPNGSGKTTLGKLIAGLLPAPKGSIWFQGQDLCNLPSYKQVSLFGYVFQNPEHQFIAETVLEECVFGLKMKNGVQPWQETPMSILDQGEQILEQFGLLTHKHKHPFLLSTGEKRLLSIASTVLVEPAILVLDEPTAGQDYRTIEYLMSWCDSYVKQGNVILMITHDMEQVGRWATNILSLEIKL